MNPLLKIVAVFFIFYAIGLAAQIIWWHIKGNYFK